MLFVGSVVGAAALSGSVRKEIDKLLHAFILLSTPSYCIILVGLDEEYFIYTVIQLYIILDIYRTFENFS